MLLMRQLEKLLKCSGVVRNGRKNAEHSFQCFLPLLLDHFKGKTHTFNHPPLSTSPGSSVPATLPFLSHLLGFYLVHLVLSYPSVIGPEILPLCSFASTRTALSPLQPGSQ